MNLLTIVIATHNEPPITLANTVRSIRETSGGAVTILLVDDCSNTPVYHMLKESWGHDLRIVTNKHRCGVGPSRHIGVLNAVTPWIAIMDAHMVCAPGWYEAWAECNSGMDCRKTLLCGTCLGLDPKHRDVNAPVGIYQGGTLNVCGPDKANPSKNQVLEAVWHPPTIKDCEEMPCCMGACYFLYREWFLKINALPLLRSWGEDELMLSLKTWLAGGEVCYAKNIRIGHIFPLNGEKKRFSVPPGHTAWNKLMAIHTLCPPPLADSLQAQFTQTLPAPELHAGLELLRRDWHLIAAEQAANTRLFSRNLTWLMEKFNLPMAL